MTVESCFPDGINIDAFHRICTVFPVSTSSYSQIQTITVIAAAMQTEALDFMFQTTATRDLNQSTTNSRSLTAHTLRPLLFNEPTKLKVFSRGLFSCQTVPSYP